MKKQRPTIPIAEWKLATHLEATREIQNQKGVPAYGCDCEWCFKWKRSLTVLLPKDLQEQLTRAGVELAHPTDLYKFDSDKSGACIRVVYHAVGKILEGPNQWTSTSTGEILMYSTIREQPYLSLVVFPQSQSYDKCPVLKNTSSGDLVRIDFRLVIPNEVIESNVPSRA
ncbi:hypothetical protein [Vibrio vulnificus]|uniref:hypothetical protein n=1 Tax=Vibrio vulnificus TaxID=672 RepID=UPI001A1B9E6C|nr:hypothetical protein [Vibrio vulnificus]MCG8706778.1 hypothetical protein [Vibrio vulnificus]HAS8156417.1 hypothetical protein [Vibrio vulnificus]